jgi:MFS family permease
MAFSLIEEDMNWRDVLIIMGLMGVTMIVIAGSRSPYDTPDSDSYEILYYSVNSLDDLIREPSFVYISYYLNALGFGVNALFFAYAVMSVPLRIGAICKLSPLPILTLCIYISYFYQLHDLMQMRCAVASSLFLFAIYFRANRRWWWTIFFILFGFLFHYSAFAGIIILFFSNKELKKWQRFVLAMIVPLGLLFYFFGFDYSYLVPDELGGDRLAAYRELKEKGKEDDQSWVFYKHPVFLLNVLLYYVCLIYYNVLEKSYKYMPIMLKIMAFSFICTLTLTTLSAVLASRLHEYFAIVSIFLWTAAAYAFRPVTYGKIFINAIIGIQCLANVFIYTLGWYTNHMK